MDAKLQGYREIWDGKPSLQAVYRDFYRRLEMACPPGLLLDVGGGSAHFKDYRPDIVSLDILPFKGIDVVADAHALPFAPDYFSGIVMIDVLHHLQHPIVFFREACRVLKPGGRLAMVEPGMSMLARHFYDHFHEELVDLSTDPFSEERPQSGSDPWDSNQAIPSLIFARKGGRHRFKEAVPLMKVVSAKWISLFAYPLSGGFKRWCLVPARLIQPLIKVEDVLVPLLGPICAFRHFIVIEKTG